MIFDFNLLFRLCSETVVLDPALLSTNTDTKQNLETLSRDFSTSKGREREDILLKFYSTTAEVKARAVW